MWRGEEGHWWTGGGIGQDRPVPGKESFEPLVRLREVDPRIRVAMRYATLANLTGRVIYGSEEAWLREETAGKLKRAQDTLAARGLGLKVWDAYRPPGAQAALWAVCPDARYVAPPERGSRHTRGAAVDVTLVDRVGGELEMPSGYDTMDASAGRGWAGASEMARRHVEWLTMAMTGAGFRGIDSEWWHYDDTDWETYPLLTMEFKELEGGRLPGLGGRGQG